jgi:hypothetical protein
MKPINVETLLSHSVGVSNSYYRPTETELLEEYLSIQDFLILDSKHKLQKQVEQLTERGKDSEYIIKAKLQEKDDQIQYLMKKQERFESLLQSLIDSGQLKPSIARS